MLRITLHHDEQFASDETKRVFGMLLDTWDTLAMPDLRYIDTGKIAGEFYICRRQFSWCQYSVNMVGLYAVFDYFIHPTEILCHMIASGMLK